MKQISLISASALMLTATLATAGSLTVPEATGVAVLPPPPTSDWGGFYAGVHYGFGELDDSFNVVDSTWLGGQAGYMFDFGKIVVGAEVSYSMVDQDFWGEELSVVRLKGRVGYDAGKFLPYAVVGPSFWSSDVQGNASGLVYGVGAEYAVSDRIRIGAEYLIDGNSALEWTYGFGAYDFSTSELSLHVNFAF